MNIKESSVDVESTMAAEIAASIVEAIDQDILSKMNIKLWDGMPGIYLDQSQCKHFGLPYFKRSEATWLKANEILGSKRQGYDEHHRKLLVHRGDGPVLIHRNEQDVPGWYNVTG